MALWLCCCQCQHRVSMPCEHRRAVVTSSKLLCKRNGLQSNKGCTWKCACNKTCLLGVPTATWRPHGRQGRPMHVWRAALTCYLSIACLCASAASTHSRQAGLIYRRRTLKDRHSEQKASQANPMGDEMQGAKSRGLSCMNADR